MPKIIRTEEYIAAKERWTAAVNELRQITGGLSARKLSKHIFEISGRTVLFQSVDYWLHSKCMPSRDARRALNAAFRHHGLPPLKADGTVRESEKVAAKGGEGN